MRKFLYKLFVPSWESTLTDKKWQNPVTKISDGLKSQENQLPKKVSPTAFAQRILDGNVTSESQKIMVRRYLKLAKFDLIISTTFVIACFIILASIAIGSPISLYGVESTYLLVILFTSLIQMLRLLVDHLHKAKQIVVGCAFPNYLMFTSPKNLRHFYEGVYIKDQLVYKALPLIDEVLNQLRALEGRKPL